MRFLQKANTALLVGLITLGAFAWLGVAYIVADTGYPGGISARDEQLIYSTVSLVLGMAGWLVVWRREGYVKDLGVMLRGGWGVFWGAGVWFMLRAFT